jgi:uncharacterized protein YjbI with pentapeptide repeats
VAAPLLVLLAAEAATLPYHSETVTWWQRGVVAADLFCILLLLPGILADLKGSRVWSGVMYAALFVLLIPIILLSYTIFMIPEEPLEIWIVRQLSDAWKTHVEYERKRDSDIFDSSPPTLRYREMSMPTFYLFENATTPFGMRRNLLLSRVHTLVSRPLDAQVAARGDKDAWTQFGKGISLIGRDFRFANLSHADLRSADVRGASFRGADLSGASLDYVLAESQPFSELLSCAGIIASGSCRTDFTGAYMSNVTARYANFRGAVFLAANLREANLQHANFSSVSLHLASLVQVSGEDADFTFAGARGTSFREATLVKAKLTYIDAVVADFSRALLASSNLDYATLTGANMDSANLLDASLGYDAKLEAVSFHLTRSEHDPAERSADVAHAQVGPPTQGDIDEITKQIKDVEVRAIVKGRLDPKGSTRSRKIKVTTRKLPEIKNEIHLQPLKITQSSQ